MNTFFSSSFLLLPLLPLSFLPLPLAHSLLSLPPLSLLLLLFYPLVLLPHPPLRILPPPSCSFSSSSSSSSCSSSSLSSLPLSYSPFRLPSLLNVFFLNLSCVYSFCFVLLNFTCLRVAVCLSMFHLIKPFFKPIIKHCTNRTRRV